MDAHIVALLGHLLLRAGWKAHTERLQSKGTPGILLSDIGATSKDVAMAIDIRQPALHMTWAEDDLVFSPGGRGSGKGKRQLLQSTQKHPFTPA